MPMLYMFPLQSILKIDLIKHEKAQPLSRATGLKITKIKFNYETSILNMNKHYGMANILDEYVDQPVVDLYVSTLAAGT